MGDQQRKCIAVIISKPERAYQTGLLRGVCESAFANDMNVAVFATTLLDGMSEFTWGELKIFDLIRYEKFAGIVYAGNTFYDADVSGLLNKKMLEAHKSGIPIASIDAPLEGIPAFYNDDKDAVKNVLLHLIRDHDVKDIAFMTGTKGFSHAEKVLNIYRDTMAEYDLPVLPDRVYYGNYWYNESANFVDILAESPHGLPQAIVCANEYMAIGVYKALHAKGIYVPKNILVGCTSIDSSTIPYLLTVENGPENAGREACNAIIDALSGSPRPAEEYYISGKTTLKTSIGCGCRKVSEYNYSEDRGILVDTDPGYFSEFNFFREDILSRDNYAALFRMIDSNMQDISGFRGIYFCMCDGWDDSRFYIQDTRQNDYTDRMQLFYCHENLPENQEIYIGRDRYFSKNEIFPKLFDASGEPSIYLLRSLHFLDRNFGFIVLDNAQQAKVYDYTFNYWLRDVANALESQCRLQSIHFVYYKDVMTGLYNRNGFNSLLKSPLQDAIDHNQHVFVAAADMNGLKMINDTYGHEEGDTAIKASASLLKEHRIPNASYEKNFRIGGDEFVKIAIGRFTEQTAVDFQNSLYTDVEKFSQSSGKPYRTQMSLGICFKTIGSLEEIDILLSCADKLMYQEKKRLKAER